MGFWDDNATRKTTLGHTGRNPWTAVNTNRILNREAHFTTSREVFDHQVSLAFSKTLRLVHDGRRIQFLGKWLQCDENGPQNVVLRFMRGLAFGFPFDFPHFTAFTLASGAQSNLVSSCGTIANGIKSLCTSIACTRDFLRIQVRVTTEWWTTGPSPFWINSGTSSRGRMGVRPNRNISLVVAIWGTIIFVFIAGGSPIKTDARMIRRKTRFPGD